VTITFPGPLPRVNEIGVMMRFPRSARGLWRESARPFHAGLPGAPRRYARPVQPPRPAPARGIAVGTDIASVADVARSVERFGDRYLHRVYTDRELAESGRRPDRLAARFAGKEAVVKLLRPEPSTPVVLTEIAVVHDRAGAPVVELTGGARDLAERRGIGRIAISLSHDGDYAMGTAACRTGTAVFLARIRRTLTPWNSSTPRRSTKRPAAPSGTRSTSTAS
jgi:holo-[acyl-carrier protein] synthase